eukprot:6098764-Prymnesium_polylepis.1
MCPRIQGDPCPTTPWRRKHEAVARGQNGEVRPQPLGRLPLFCSGASGHRRASHTQPYWQCLCTRAGCTAAARRRKPLRLAALWPPAPGTRAPRRSTTPRRL